MGNIKIQDPNKSKGRAVSINPRVKTPVNQALRRLRAARMVEDRITGSSIKDLSFKYNIGIETVSNELKFAKESGIIESLEDRILKELVPLAIDTYTYKMKEDKDAYVAKDVLTNLARLSDKQERKQKEDDTSSLEAYIKLRTPKLSPSTNQTKPEITLNPNFTKAITATIEPSNPAENDPINAIPYTQTTITTGNDIEGSSEDPLDDEDA